MTHTTELYFECHVTVEPVYGERLERLKAIAAEPGIKFRVADLLMRKRMEDTPERSSFDTFCTGRDVIYINLEERMCNLVEALFDDGFAVWRYKIENTLLDVRCKPAGA